MLCDKGTREGRNKYKCVYMYFWVQNKYSGYPNLWVREASNTSLLLAVNIWLAFEMINFYFGHTFSSVQFRRSVVSDSLRPHESQHARPPCPSPTPGVYSNSCPSSQQCHPAISSTVVPFSTYPQSLPASQSFPMSQLFTPGGQSIGSFSFSIRTDIRGIKLYSGISAFSG